MGSGMEANYTTTELYDPRQTAYPLCASQLGLHQHSKALHSRAEYSTGIFCVPTGYQAPITLYDSGDICPYSLEGGFIQ